MYGAKNTKLHEKLFTQLKKRFPTIRNYQNLVDVIEVAHGLHSVDASTGKNRGKYELKGLSPYAIKIAFEKHILDKNYPPKAWFVLSGRGLIIKKGDLESQLNKELTNFYKHLQDDTRVQTITKTMLNLPDEAKIREIKSKIDDFSLPERIYFYDKLIKRLEKEEIYNIKYDYKWMGYRTRAALYWLSKLGKRLSTFLDN